MSTDSRPAKRQRRSAAVLSDDEDITTTTGSLPLRNSKFIRSRTASQASGPVTTAPKRTRNVPGKSTKTTSAQPSPKSSPEKARKSKKLSIDDTKNKSLHNFFGKATNEERWSRSTADQSDHTKIDNFDDDIVDDDSLDEALAAIAKTEKENDHKQEPFGSQTKSLSPSTSSKALPTSSQRFRKPVLPVKTAIITTRQDNRAPDDNVKPWAEKYAPISLDELSVHKKKVQDVQKWLDDALLGRAHQRLLILKGPAGAGKSTTINLLSQAKQLEIVAWQNPDTSETGALSSSLQFAEFVTRGGDYGALSLSASDQSTTTHSAGRVLLVEDFPASMTRTSVALESFRSVLLHAVTNTTASLQYGQSTQTGRSPPIVMIISETLISSSTAFSDSFTAQRLLGPELINHPSVSVIEFNPVAPTFVSKAIDLVIKKEARDSSRRRIPGPAVLQKLAEIGDVRNVINTLQFLCTRGDDLAGWSGTVAANAKRTAKSSKPLSEMEENSIKLISSRETTLDMFHAAGKVCYNKREDPRVSDTRASPPPKPPDHLSHLHRPKISQVDIEELLNETGTDIQTFVSTVHENYVLSCSHEDFVDYIDDCASYLSDCELLDPDSRHLAHSRARAKASPTNNIQQGSSDALRQDEISFHVATRGVLFSLPFPVSRAAPLGARKGDAFKMYYPASLRLWKPTEETNDLIDLAMSQLSGGDLALRHRARNDPGVSSWTSRSNAFATQPRNSNDSDEDTPARTDMSKDSLILDTFPYLTQIQAAQGGDTNVLRKITQMRGFSTSNEEEEDDAPLEPKPTPMVATARLVQKAEAVTQALQARQSQSQSKLTSRNASATEPAIEKLFLEDDDIEDD